VAAADRAQLGARSHGAKALGSRVARGGDHRAARLLGELRQEQPAADQLAHRVTRGVRWQRPLRQALEGIGAIGGGAFSGLVALLRGRRS